ncbi:MAG: hypothetical protein ACI85F_000925 [Bacteroidia bacterium]
MNILNKYLPYLAVMLGALLIIFRFYGDIMADPSVFVFGVGDGIKNYYTVLYQVVHGEGWFFKGMLHPYGDQLTFADGQPVLTSLFKMFFEPSVANGQAMMGAMNIIMIMSLVLCALLVHSILKKALIPAWFAVPFALIIAFLSPQIQRFSGHYALAYTFYIPLLWWMIIKIYEADKKWVWALLYYLVVAVFSLNQPYHLLISLAFAGSLFAFNAFRIIAFKADRSMWPWLLGIVVLPAISMAAYFSFTEIYSDRPLAPYGMGAYESSFSSVFVPIHGPMFTLVRDYLFRIWTHPEWEGQGYVGLPATLFLFFFLWKVVADIRRKKWKAPLWLSSPNVVRNAFIPSILVLFISAGILNRLGLLWLSDHILALKQFRSLGRLVWIFYYVFTVSAVVYFYMVFRHLQIASKGKLKVVANSMMALVFIIWGVDMTSNIKGIKGLMLMNHPNEFTFNSTFNDQLENAGYKSSDFQAILPIPFSLVGSEKIGLEGAQGSFTMAANASFSTGLPMFGGLMSRTSLSVTEKQAQLVAHPVITRAILDDLESDLPILVLRLNGDLTQGEQFIVDQGKEILSNESFTVYALELMDVSNASQNRLDLSEINAFFSDASVITINPEQLLLDTVINVSKSGLNAEVSYWLKLNQAETGLPEVELLHFQSNLVDTVLIKPTEYADILNGWVRIEKQLTLYQGKNLIKLSSTTRGGTLSHLQLNTFLSSGSENKESGIWWNYPLVQE